MCIRVLEVLKVVYFLSHKFNPKVHNDCSLELPPRQRHTLKDISTLGYTPVTSNSRDFSQFDRSFYLKKCK